MSADTQLNRRRITVAIPYLWLAIFFLAPFLIVVKISFSEATLSIPPYLPMFDWAEDLETGERALSVSASLANYIALIADDLYAAALVSSLKIAAISTLVALIIGLPMAYAIARAPDRLRHILLLLVILPFWTSFLIRVYAWIGILKSEGLLNLALDWVGVINSPLTILYTDIAVYVGIVYTYLPFMILPIYATLVKTDNQLIEAAIDLGCHPIRAFWAVTVPLARPGIVAGCLLVFIPAVGEFVIPDLLGGSETLMIGHTLWVEFFNNRDWPLASAVAVVMLALLLAPMIYLRRYHVRTLEMDQA